MTKAVVREAPLNTAVVRLAANPASIGANVLVSAQAGAKYRVLALALVSTGANTVTIQSNSTAISGAFDFAANGGMVLDFNEHGWAETAVGEALNLNLSAGTKVAVTVIYQVLTSGL